MTDAPDIEALARRYLDLWQDQMAAYAADPALVETMARSMAMMQAGAAGWLFNQMTAGSSNGRQDDQRGNRTGAGGAAGAASAAAAPSEPDLDAGQLARRVALLERRVAELESALAETRRGAARRGTRRSR